jgi:hypothetical protein
VVDQKNRGILSGATRIGHVKAPWRGGDQVVADLKTKFPLKPRITRYHILEKAVL